MNPDQFRLAAEAATAHVTLDADRLLSGVYRKHARGVRRRRALATVPLVAALAVGGATLPSVLGPSMTAPALAAYDFGEVRAGTTPVATFRDVELHHLPDGAADRITGAEVFQLADGSGQVDYTARWDGGSDLALSVTEAPGLTLESYLESHWFGGEHVETTVGGRPALANGVEADGASGLLWSPRDGIVVEVHLGSGDGEELRRVVEQMSLAEGEGEPA